MDTVERFLLVHFNTIVYLANEMISIQIYKSEYCLLY